MRALVIVCSRPGLIRAGRPHPPVATYDVADFTREDLEEMLAEPELTLVFGDLTTTDMLDAMVESGAEPAPKKRDK